MAVPTIQVTAEGQEESADRAAGVVDVGQGSTKEHGTNGDGRLQDVDVGEGGEEAGEDETSC